uniref:Transposase n=1 Tax=Angiostrongylus cantonensis TaxID=6313 RepID=A0A0K0DQI1_ANGCA
MMAIVIREKKLDLIRSLVKIANPLTSRNVSNGCLKCRGNWLAVEQNRVGLSADMPLWQNSINPGRKVLKRRNVIQKYVES